MYDDDIDPRPVGYNQLKLRGKIALKSYVTSI